MKYISMLLFYIASSLFAITGIVMSLYDSYILSQLLYTNSLLCYITALIKERDLA